MRSKLGSKLLAWGVLALTVVAAIAIITGIHGHGAGAMFQRNQMSATER
jgi:hypothetical protein